MKSARENCSLQTERSIPVLGCQYNHFEIPFQNIQIFVEQLKKPSMQITDKEDSYILAYINKTFSFLQLKEALDNPKLYRNALISFSNLLSLKFSVFRKDFLSDIFFGNLIKYFKILAGSQNLANFNMQIYPVLYIIVLIIYNADRDISKILCKKLFTKQFLVTLNELQIKEGNKVEKYLPVIIAFIAKNSNKCSSLSLLKSIVLNNLKLGKNQKTQFQFVYSLRVLISQGTLSLNEIRKHSVLEYVTSYLQCSQSEQSTTMIIEILKNIFKRYPILGYNIVNAQTLTAIQKSFKHNAQETLNLLQIIIPCFPTAYKQKMFEIHTTKIMKNMPSNNDNRQLSNVDYFQSLRIVSILLPQIRSQHSLLFVQSVGFSSILNRINENETQEKNLNILATILKRIFSGLSEYDEHIAQTFIGLLEPFKDSHPILSETYSLYSKQHQEDTMCCLQ